MVVNKPLDSTKIIQIPLKARCFRYIWYVLGDPTTFSSGVTGCLGKAMAAPSREAPEKVFGEGSYRKR